MKNLEFESLSLLNRLERLTAEGLVHPSWVQNLDKYGLLYEVTMSSGLTLDDINSVDNETFINRVNWGYVGVGSMTNNTVKTLCEQLEESNDCMLALADTLRKYGHNTTDLLEQVKRNEIIIELCKIGAWING